MNYFLFIIKSAYGDLMKNKIRTFLTTLGIVIGVASVVLLIAFGLGLKEYIGNQFDSLGSNLVFVLPGQMLNRGAGLGAAFGNEVNFNEEDLARLKKIKSAQVAIPNIQKSIKIDFTGKTEYATLNGTSQDIFEARNLVAIFGRVFDKTDIEKKGKIVVLGSEIAKKLFNEPDLALDKKVRIEDQSFKVIGILEAKGGGGFGGPNFDMFAYIPYTSAFNLVGKKTFSTFTLKAVDNDSIEQLKAEAKKIMLKKYKEDDFTVVDSKEILNTIQSIFTMLNSVLVAIGGVSLVVGGIGIMNIMYVSVTERIREIGIRRALGAFENDILWQFLAESVLLSVLGGILGLILAYGIVYIIRIFFPAYIDIPSVVMAIGVSSFIGIFFGVFPARSAARLSPIDAIRYE